MAKFDWRFEKVRCNDTILIFVFVWCEAVLNWVDMQAFGLDFSSVQIHFCHRKATDLVKYVITNNSLDFFYVNLPMSCSSSVWKLTVSALILRRPSWGKSLPKHSCHRWPVSVSSLDLASLILGRTRTRARVASDLLFLNSEQFQICLLHLSVANSKWQVSTLSFLVSDSLVKFDWRMFLSCWTHRYCPCDGGRNARILRLAPRLCVGLNWIESGWVPVRSVLAYSSNRRLRSSLFFAKTSLHELDYLHLVVVCSSPSCWLSFQFSFSTESGGFLEARDLPHSVEIIEAIHLFHVTCFQAGVSKRLPVRQLAFFTTVQREELEFSCFDSRVLLYSNSLLTFLLNCVDWSPVWFTRYRRESSRASSSCQQFAWWFLWQKLSSTPESSRETSCWNQTSWRRWSWEFGSMRSAPEHPETQFVPHIDQSKASIEVQLWSLPAQTFPCRRRLLLWGFWLRAACWVVLHVEQLL